MRKPVDCHRSSDTPSEERRAARANTKRIRGSTIVAAFGPPVFEAAKILRAASGFTVSNGTTQKHTKLMHDVVDGRRMTTRFY